MVNDNDVAIRRLAERHSVTRRAPCGRPKGAEALSRKPGHIGALAFSRSGDPTTGTSATPS
jgi:hypothetical protein